MKWLVFLAVLAANYAFIALVVWWLSLLFSFEFNFGIATGVYIIVVFAKLIFSNNN